MNPPYGREIGAWMRKAYDESRRGAVVVCLVPARTDTTWWHEFAVKGRVTFVRGRLKFNGHKSGAPFPSAVVVFDGLGGDLRRQADDNWKQFISNPQAIAIENGEANN